MAKTEVRLIRLPNGDFRASLEEDFAELERVKVGNIITVPFRIERNAAFARKYWAMVQAVADNTSTGHNKEQIKIILKNRLGWFDEVKDPFNGEIILAQRSIKFNKMTEAEFSDFYKKSCHELMTRFLPSWTQKDMDIAVDIVENFLFN
jgi:hypothetical protein